MAFDNRYPQQPPQAMFPKGYLEGGYFELIDGKQALKSDYIISYAKFIKDTFNRPSSQYKKDQLKKSQLRKFYDCSIGLRERLRQNSNNYELIKAEVARLIPFAQQSNTKGKAPQAFVDFMVKNFAAINNAEDYVAFTKHFEAIVAYYPETKD